MQTNDWTHSESHRKFMEEYARDNRFDPLVPENWYSVERSDIVKEVCLFLYCLYIFYLECRVDCVANFSSQAPGLLQYYDDSFVEAVIAIFPELTFQIHKFKQAPSMFLHLLRSLTLLLTIL